MLTEDLVIHIVEANSLGDYRLSLQFSDGTKRIIDFGPFLKRSSHSDIKKYLDLQQFLGFVIDGGAWFGRIMNSVFLWVIYMMEKFNQIICFPRYSAGNR